MELLGMSGVWILIVIIAIIVELITVGLVSIWFVFGGIVALAAQIIGAPISIQVALFILVSVISMVLTRPWAVKFLNSRKVASNLEEIPGSIVMVVETINNKEGTGKVLRNGLEWTARAENDGETFSPQERVKVARVSGVKLMVEKF